VPFLKYTPRKLKLRVFLAGHSVAMVAYCVTKMIPTCSPVIGQLFDTMVVASSDKEWQKRTIKIYLFESTGNCYEPP